MAFIAITNWGSFYYKLRLLVNVLLQIGAELLQIEVYMLQIGQLLQIEAITPNQCTEVVTGS